MSGSDTKALLGGTRTAKTFSTPGFHRMQRRHFLLFDALPAAGTLLALALIPWLPPRPVDIALFFILWLATGLGLTVGFHRYFSHRAFATTQPVALGLLVAGSMAGRGPMMSWVAMHRRHHECADREGDLHSPNLHGSALRGLLHAHLTWMIRHDYPNVMHYTPDLMNDRTIRRWNRRYYGWVALGLALPALIGGLAGWSVAGGLSGFLWGGVVRLFVVEHTMSAINSLCHRIGDRPHEGRDNSRNNGWLGLVSWGESWHNNHHATPNAAAFGRRWSEIDPGFWLIRGLQAVGLAWDVRRPVREP